MKKRDNQMAVLPGYNLHRSTHLPGPVIDCFCGPFAVMLRIVEHPGVDPPQP